MLKKWLRYTISHPFIRIALATALLIAGLAPVGAPILSESAWRQAAPSDPGTNTPSEQTPFTYRWTVNDAQATRVERSDDGGATWHGVAEIPATIAQLQAVRGDEQIVAARSAEAIWVSRDGGSSWSLTKALPSRPLSLAVTSKETGMLLVGTESLGLLVSRDLGGDWQANSNPMPADSGIAPLAVNALTVDPTDDNILYAASGLWLGTSTARLTPIGTFASVDGGQHWLMLARAPLGASSIIDLDPVEGKPLTIAALDTQGTRTTLALTLNADLISLLESPEAGVRAATARALGLIGDPAAAPVLLAGLTDPDPLAGDRAAEALGRLGDTSIVPALLNALEDPNETAAARAARVLGMLRATAAVDRLGEMLQSDRPLVIRSAAEALAAIGSPDALAALLVPLADAEMTPGRHAAMAGLEAVGADAVAPLTAALTAQNADLRANAAEMLGYLPATSSTAALVRALDDAEPSVRAEAAWALGEIGTAEARSALAAAARTEADATAKTAAASALARVDAANSGRSTSFNALLLAQFSQISASRWTFMVLSMALAAALLWVSPRQARLQRR